MIQDVELVQLLVGVLSGLVIAAALTNSRRIATVILLVAASIMVFTVADSGVPGLVRRFADLAVHLPHYRDFFVGFLLGKIAHAVLAASSRAP